MLKVGFSNIIESVKFLVNKSTLFKKGLLQKSEFVLLQKSHQSNFYNQRPLSRRMWCYLNLPCSVDQFLLNYLQFCWNFLQQLHQFYLFHCLVVPNFVRCLGHFADSYLLPPQFWKSHPKSKMDFWIVLETSGETEYVLTISLIALCMYFKYTGCLT